LLLKTVNHILDTVGMRGAWGGDFEDWEPIITALTVKLLFQAGFKPETSWSIVKDDKIQNMVLSTSILFLNGCIGDDGNFGEDIWDASRFASIVEEYQLHDRVGRYHMLKKYILEYSKNQNYRREKGTWAGPGSIAAIIDYLDLVHETALSGVIFDDLTKLQLEDGSFHGHMDEVGNEFVHTIWHTTQVLMTYLGRGVSERDSRVQSMIQFICATQEKNTGCWRAFSQFDVYFTSYALMALNRLSRKPQDAIATALGWLSTQVSNTGKIRDIGGTTMGGLALISCYGSKLEFPVTLAEIRKLEMAEHVNTKLTRELAVKQEALSRKDEELQTFRNKYSGAEIVLTKKEVFKYTIVVGILGVILTLVPSLITRPSPPQIVVIRDQETQDQSGSFDQHPKGQHTDSTTMESGEVRNSGIDRSITVDETSSGMRR